jgi:hypothetical protein
MHVLSNTFAYPNLQNGSNQVRRQVPAVISMTFYLEWKYTTEPILDQRSILSINDSLVYT